jgi:hypothetical protein
MIQVTSSGCDGTSLVIHTSLNLIYTPQNKYTPDHMHSGDRSLIYHQLRPPVNETIRGLC